MSLIAAGVISVAVSGGEAVDSYNQAQDAKDDKKERNALAAGHNKNAQLARGLQERHEKQEKQYEPAMMLSAKEAEKKGILNEQAIPLVSTLATRESKRLAIDPAEHTGLEPGTARREAIDVAGGAGTANTVALESLNLEGALDIDDFQRRQKATQAGKRYSGVI